MLLVLTAVAFLIVGDELSRRLWARCEPALHPLERWSSSILIGIGLWLMTVWVAALSHTMTRPVLIGRTVIIVSAAAVVLWRNASRRTVRVDRVRIAPRSAALLLAAVLPIAMWTGFVLWRSAIVPPLNHDALAYHLPKAVLFSRAHGYEYLRDLDPMTRKLPANYELLLADVLTMEGSDDISEWVSTIFYLFAIVGSGALVQRWWGRNLVSEATVMLLVAGAPVMLLHTGAHKNDLMTASFMIATLLWSGRWISERQIPALLLAIASTAMAIGTKPQAAGLAAMLAPFVLFAWWKDRARFTTRHVSAIVLFGLASLTFLGGAVYALNYWNEHTFGAHHAAVTNARAAFTYGDWSNLWQGPYVLLAAPLSLSSGSLRVPWSAEPWFWRRYELFFSHLGIAFTLCALLLPLVVVRLHRTAADAMQRERTQVSLATAAAFVLMLPVIFVPHGMYTISLPRYALFVLPVVFALTVVPALRMLEVKSNRGPAIILAGAVVLFCAYAVEFAIQDAFVPWDYVAWARRHPGTRVIPFYVNRAASVADRIAGPNDTIAMDINFGAWIQPAFGSALSRPVRFIPPTSGAPQIADDVRWVVIDRSWRTLWDVPGFTDLSQAGHFLGGGKPDAEDLHVLRYLDRDPRFERVFYNRRRNQAVFVRRAGPSRNAEAMLRRAGATSPAVKMIANTSP